MLQSRNFVYQSSIVPSGGILSQVSLTVGNDYPMGEVWCETIYQPSDAVSLLNVSMGGTAQYVLDGSTCSPAVYQDSVGSTNQNFMGYTMVNGKRIYFIGSDAYFNLQFIDNLGSWHCSTPETIQIQVDSVGTNAILGLISQAITTNAISP